MKMANHAVRLMTFYLRRYQIFFLKQNKLIIPIAFLLVARHSFCQTADTSHYTSAQHFSISATSLVYNKPFPVRSFTIPVLAVAYGVATLESKGLKSINNELKEEIWTEGRQRHTKLDNYLQWTPTVMVYGLNIAGVHGKNNLRDRTMIYLLSQVIMNATVFPLKHVTHQYRPDGSDPYSFPSGHTANAFVGAEFMWKEYKDISPLLAASGYLVAGATGLLRMYNNKHWLSDVVAGAGIGVASTRLAYWLYPKIEHAIFKRDHPATIITPVYQNGALGLGLVRVF